MKRLYISLLTISVVANCMWYWAVAASGEHLSLVPYYGPALCFKNGYGAAICHIGEVYVNEKNGTCFAGPCGKIVR